jgi:hypothetical protein
MQNDLNMKQCFYNPYKEYNHQKGNETGGDDHNCCCFNETIQQVLELLHHSGYGAGQVTQKCFCFINYCGILLTVVGYFADQVFADGTGGFNRYFNGFRINCVDLIGNPYTGRDHQKHCRTENHKFRTDAFQQARGEKEVYQQGTASGGDEYVAGGRSQNGEQIFFQIDDTEDQHEIGCEI